MVNINIKLCSNEFFSCCKKYFKVKNYFRYIAEYMLEWMIKEPFTNYVPFLTTSTTRFSSLHCADQAANQGSVVKQKDSSFHVSFKSVAIFVLFLALMPVWGISQRDPKFLKFKWKSIRIIHTLACILKGTPSCIDAMIWPAIQYTCRLQLGVWLELELSIRTITCFSLPMFSHPKDCGIKHRLETFFY